MYDPRDYPAGVTVPPYVPGKDRALRPGARSMPGGAPGGAGGMLPGGPFPGGGAGGISLSLQPPTWVRPPGARDFTLAGTFSGASVATTPALIPGATFTVPPGYAGVIRSVVFLVINPLTTSDIRFSMLFNGGPVEGWSNVLVLPRLASSVSASYGPDETAIPVPEGNAVTMSVTVADAGAYQVSAQAHGWFFDKALAQAFDAAYQGV